jgi:probable F420-dependent oxidoreductase
VRFGICERFSGAEGHDHRFVIDAAQLIEGLGFATIFAPKYLFHLPAYPRSKYPYGASDKVPDHGTGDSVRGFYDPIVTLSAIAQVTTTVGLATYPVFLPYFHPVVFARTIATLDHMCDGRLELGIGVGWAREEYEAMQIPFDERGAITDDHLDALIALWSDEEFTTFSGRYHQFGPIHSFPKPIQRPHPPVIVCGSSPPALRRVARRGQGWAGVQLDRDGVVRTLERLDRELEQVGRNLSDVTHRVGRTLSADPTTRTEQLHELVRFADECARLGIDEMVIASPSVAPSEHEGIMTEVASALGVGAGNR